jgi:hypothetical protein
MPTLNEVRDTVNSWLAARWPLLVERQEAYFTIHARYFQGLWTHSVVPDDGAEIAPDQRTSKPGDQQARWADFFSLPDVLPCALRIDVYEGDQGHGWTATVRVRVAGTIYQRIAHVGPQTWRVQNWDTVTTVEEEQP